MSYAGIPYSDMQQGTSSAANPDQLKVNVHLSTLQLRASAPSNTEFSVQLPAGRLSTSTLQTERTDTNIGDLELRVKQVLPWLKKPRLELGVGLALPTGPYVEKSGAANLPPEASFLTLGRGVSWGILELQASVPISEKVSSYVQLSARHPMSNTEDEFSWGDEARAVVGGQFRLPYNLSALGIAEMQWRGGATEPDPFAGTRVESANAGGIWWTLTPALSYRPTSGVSILGGLRVPLHADVHGNQLIPGIGGFVAVSLSWAKEKTSNTKAELATEKTPEKPFVPEKPTLGQITIVDYWATWCAPCETITKLLDEAEPTWTNVDIKKVDATGWPDNGVELPEGAEGLPAIELFDAEGKRTHLLIGPDALKVVDIVNAMRAEQRENEDAEKEGSSL